MEKKPLLKLSLKKETITRLNDDQLMKFVGGTSPEEGTSCGSGSCDSQRGADSCDSDSCNCKPPTPPTGS